MDQDLEGITALDALSQEEKTALTRLRDFLSGFLDDKLKRFTLYGSKARGDHHRESDIDVAIIVQDLTRETKNRILKEVARIEFDHLVPLSTIVFSEDEFEHLKKRERRIALDIEGEGIPL
jgi:predicted nucleotidyltransferase